MKRSIKLSSILATSVLLCIACNQKHSFLQNRIAINSTLQTIVQQHVSEATQHIHAEWGLGVLLDLQNSTICALYSTDTTHNHAFTEMEMGTIMLPFSVLSALCTQVIPLDTTFQYPAPIHFSPPGRYYDHNTTYHLRDIIANSQALITDDLIEIAFHDNPQQMYEFFRHTLGIQLFQNSEQVSYRGLIDRSVGYHYTTTPLHVLSLYGKMALQQLPCDTAAQRLICQGMHDVVWNNEYGTASITPWGTPKAQSKQVSIAGKTGSVSLNVNGRRSDRHHCISFVGYFPEERPRYACLVMFNAPKFPYDAGSNCGSCVRLIAEDIY